MRMSEIFTKTRKTPPKDEESANAIYLERGGFIYKNSAGVYTFLPLGFMVLAKITNIVREEMNAIGGQEILMPALVEKKYLDATGRWDVEVGFDVLGKKDKKPAFALGWTHEEVLTEIASKHISSYQDLPFSAYQIQAKFRNEPRAKSGLLRGREFLMKDLYSFHASEDDLLKFYGRVRLAYEKIFARCGLKSIYTLAGGGDFTASTTHEFQVASLVGEDLIFVCRGCSYAENSEISKLKDGDSCPRCQEKMQAEKAIEVGNIFPLGTAYSKAFGLKFLNKDGKKELVVMGSYGMGIGRVMGAVVETHHDERGIIWPETISPFKVHLIALDAEAPKIYDDLIANNIEVLYDNRYGKSAGEKFADADLVGIPLRVVVSAKTLARDSVEVKKRDSSKVEFIKITNLLSYIRTNS